MDMNKPQVLADQDLEQVVGGISSDEALATALKHVNLTRNSIDYVKKVDLDYENGRKIYEIEFYKGGMEYEFEVDAVTGRILKSKKDWD